MADFSSKKEVERLKEKLKEIQPNFNEFEEEELILYPFVQENLKKVGISHPL